MNNKLQVFIITNGRSTFKYAYKCLQKQNVKPIVIKDMIWVDALNKMVDICETEYLIRCDDDFLLHKNAVEFIFTKFIKKEQENKNVIMGLFKLWEDWASRIIGGIKIYKVKYVRELGGFEANYRGKVDGLFSKKVKKSKYTFTGDKLSVVGIHSRGTLEEQMQYADLWSDIGDKPYTKWKPDKKTTKQMKSYTKSVEDQYKMTTKFLEKLNKKQNSDFYRFIKKRKKSND